MYFIYIDIDALQFVFLFVFAFVFVFVFVFARSKLWGEGMYSGRVVADFRCLISKQLQTPPHPPCLASGRNWFYFGWKTLNCSIVWCYGQCIVIAMDGEWSLKLVAREWGQKKFVDISKTFSNLIFIPIWIHAWLWTGGLSEHDWDLDESLLLEWAPAKSQHRPSSGLLPLLRWFQT